MAGVFLWIRLTHCGYRAAPAVPSLPQVPFSLKYGFCGCPQPDFEPAGTRCFRSHDPSEGR